MIDDDKYLRVAAVIDAHGLNGRLKIHIITDSPSRFKKGNALYYKKNESFINLTISEFVHGEKRKALIRFSEIDHIDSAMPLKGAELFIPKSAAENAKDELGEDDFYYYELTGCAVYIDGALYGEVTDVLEAGAGDILVIKDRNGSEHMVPFVESMVGTDRVSEKIIDIYPIEGLLDF